MSKMENLRKEAAIRSAKSQTQSSSSSSSGFWKQLSNSALANDRQSTSGAALRMVCRLMPSQNTASQPATNHNLHQDGCSKCAVLASERNWVLHELKDTKLVLKQEQTKRAEQELLKKQLLEELKQARAESRKMDQEKKCLSCFIAYSASKVTVAMDVLRDENKALIEENQYLRQQLRNRSSSQSSKFTSLPSSSSSSSADLPCSSCSSCSSSCPKEKESEPTTSEADMLLAQNSSDEPMQVTVSETKTECILSPRAVIRKTTTTTSTVEQVPVPNGKAASQEQPVSLQKADSSSNDLLAQPVPCGVACFSVWGRLWDRVFKTETGQRSKSQ